MIVTAVDDAVFVDGVEVTRNDFRKKEFRAKEAYALRGVHNAHLEALMSEDDSVWSAGKGGLCSFTFKVSQKGAFHVVPISVWGVETEDPIQAQNELDDLFDACEATLASVTPKNKRAAGRTAASTAGRICRALWATRQGVPIGYHQLYPRWRLLAHKAIHQGPQLALRGGAERAAQIDRTKAFLGGLFQPVPVRFVADLNPDWQELRESEDQGIVRATVRLDPTSWAGRLPPLPVRLVGGHGTVYPVGIFRGVWTLDLLRQAESLGAEVVHLHEVALAFCHPVHERAGAFLEALPHEALRKLLYTRYWGRLAAPGGWEGTLHQQSDLDCRFPGSKLWWRWSGNTICGMASPDYRPDHAAFIATFNQIAMNEALRSLPAGSVIGAHVDALWLDEDRVSIPSDPPGFKVKRRGKLRFYGTGTYSHSGEHHAQGCPYPVETEEQMQQWAGGLQNATWVRKWHHWSASESASATSDPPVYTEKNFQSYPEEYRLQAQEWGQDDFGKGFEPEERYRPLWEVLQ